MGAYSDNNHLRSHSVEARAPLRSAQHKDGRGPPTQSGLTPARAEWGPHFLACVVCARTRVSEHDVCSICATYEGYMSDYNVQGWVTIEARGRSRPPDWAVRQRYLIRLMDEATTAFVERYTRPDGTLIWRDTWPGMDGSDDGYESFVSFPLFYLLGGSEHIHQMARQEWNAVTWQFTGYAQVWRVYDAYYDWMHHGESSTYIYYLGMADPYHHVDRTRAQRFAGMYIGEDSDAANWDPVLKMIRSPINGSRGPRFQMSAEDWVTHRSVLANYLTPYEDVPGFENSDPFTKLDWNDDETFAKILKLMNERMVPGDVPLNLNATSLVTSAYMYGGEEKYRQWVLDYLGAWRERTERNDGIRQYRPERHHRRADERQVVGRLLRLALAARGLDHPGIDVDRGPERDAAHR